LARKFLPGFPSYSLGNLCKNLNIDINGRHRAAGDALATVKLFELILQQNEEMEKQNVNNGLKLF
jgi:DNA polymerase-3 subunit epsilon